MLLPICVYLNMNYMVPASSNSDDDFYYFLKCGFSTDQLKLHLAKFSRIHSQLLTELMYIDKKNAYFHIVNMWASPSSIKDTFPWHVPISVVSMCNLIVLFVYILYLKPQNNITWWFERINWTEFKYFSIYKLINKNCLV